MSELLTPRMAPVSSPDNIYLHLVHLVIIAPCPTEVEYISDLFTSNGSYATFSAGGAGMPRNLRGSIQPYTTATY